MRRFRIENDTGEVLPSFTGFFFRDEQETKRGRRPAAGHGGGDRVGRSPKSNSAKKKEPTTNKK